MITEHAQTLKKFPSWIYKAAAQSWIDKEFPRHLFIETTASCNLKCNYCPRESNNKHMDFGVFRSIIDEAANYGPRSFSFHLFGEPLLYPQIIEAVRYTKQKNKRNTILLTTNGTLLERYIDALAREGVDKIIWSWRPEAKFSESLKEKMRLWGKLTVRLIKETVPKEEMEYWGKWPNVEVRSLHSYGGKISLEKFGVQNTNNGMRHACYHLFLAPAVNWEGKFLMCCADPKTEEVFGDINKETVAECWKRVERVRKSHLEGKYNGICKKCDIWKQYPNLFFGKTFKEETIN